MNPAGVPTFAVVGEPNDGKTTVIATLAEADSAEIGPDPGTTRVSTPFAVVFDGREVIEFVDTPGFENPLEALEWIKAHENDAGSLAESFCRAHRTNEDFSAECEILQPLADGAAVIYVVDGSQPVRQTDLAQMEIIRLVNPPDRPCIALINQKRAGGTHLQAWKKELRKRFDIVREFNAHQATFGDRLKLLQAIRSIIPEWEESIDFVIDAFRADWEKRIHDSADALCTLLEAALSCSKSEPLHDHVDAREASKQAEEGLKTEIRKIEMRFRDEVRGYFRHRRVSGPAQDSLLIQDLFSAEVVRVFGLPRKALAAAGAAIGAVLFAAGDAALHGVSLGLFALIGASVGGVAGYWGANKLVSVRVPGGLRSVLPGSMKAHGRCVIAEPGPLSNLPWTLLSRGLEFFRWASSWPHGRRDLPLTEQSPASPWNVKEWSEAQRAIARDFITLASSSQLLELSERVKRIFRASRKDPESVQRGMRTMLTTILKEMTGFGVN